MPSQIFSPHSASNTTHSPVVLTPLLPQPQSATPTDMCQELRDPQELFCRGRVTQHLRALGWGPNWC